MSLTRVGTQSAASTSVTIPAHQVGDLIVMFAYRSGSTTTPTIPTGTGVSGRWFRYTTKTGTTQSCVVAYKVATSTGETSGTWTNATELCVHVMRAPAGSTCLPGAVATSSSTTTTITFPALTMADTSSGNSWVLGFVGCSNTTQTIGTAPSGMTNQQHVTGATHQAASDDTNGGVSSWSAKTITAGTGNSVSVTLEICQLTTSTGPISGNVYQHIGGGGLLNQRGLTVQDLKIPVHNASATGNCYVLGLTWNTVNGATSGITVSSVTGSVNGSFPAATVTATGAGSCDSSIYVFPNITTGQEVITVHFSHSVTMVQYCLSELYGIDATPGAGSHAVNNSTTKAAGSYTPTNNNASGGNLIWNYFVKCDVTPNQYTESIFADSSSTLLNADSNWWNADGAVVALDGFNKAVSISLQPTSAAINPSLVTVGDTTDNWNSLSVALKINTTQGSKNSASGFQYNKFDHQCTLSFPTQSVNTTVALQTSAFGNLRIVCCDDPNLNTTFAVTDSEGHVWTGDGTTGGVGPTGATAGFWYLQNASPNPNLRIFLTGGSSDNTLSFRYFDLTVGTSAFDSAVEVSDNLTANQTTYTPGNQPSPTKPGCIIIANIGLGQGPGLSATAPTGVVWDLATYTGETDVDTLENADITSHFIASTTGVQTHTYTITAINPGISTSGGFIVFQNLTVPVVGKAAGRPGLRLSTPMSRLRGPIASYTSSSIVQAAAGLAVSEFMAQGALTATGALSGLALITAPIDAAIKATAVLTGLSFAEAPAKGVLLATGTLAGLAFSQAPVQGQLLGSGALSGVAMATAPTGDAVLLGTGALAGRALAVAPTGAAQLLATGQLAGLAASLGPVVGTIGITANGSIFGLASAKAPAIAALVGSIPVVGTSVGKGYAESILMGQAALAAIAAGKAPSSGILQALPVGAITGMSAAKGYGLSLIEFVFTQPPIQSGGVHDHYYPEVKSREDYIKVINAAKDYKKLAEKLWTEGQINSRERSSHVSRADKIIKGKK